MEVFETFCTHLAEAIEQSRFSRAELADALGVKPATIKSWCVGRRSPTVFRMLELCALLEVDASDLFAEPSEPRERTMCPACDRSFRRPVGFRIHLALRAREDEPHRRLQDEQPVSQPVAPPVRAASLPA